MYSICLPIHSKKILNVICCFYVVHCVLQDLLSIAELLGDVKPKGISSEDVTLLPEKKFHPNNKMTSCSICMSDYTLNERLKILPCFHEFHGECIEKWIVVSTYLYMLQSNNWVMDVFADITTAYCVILTVHVFTYNKKKFGIFALYV